MHLELYADRVEYFEVVSAAIGARHAILRWTGIHGERGTARAGAGSLPIGDLFGKSPTNSSSEITGKGASRASPSSPSESGR